MKGKACRVSEGRCQLKVCLDETEENLVFKTISLNYVPSERVVPYTRSLKIYGYSMREWAQNVPTEREYRGIDI